jgi:hypothetical protein
MFFSGKITNSVIHFLKKSGIEHQDIFDCTPVPEEFLQDPTGWLEAYQVEDFLNKVEAKFSQVLEKSQVSLIAEIGHQSPKLKSWGVLDSVLRLMVKPDDIFLQPQRIISYFISPAPPIANFIPGQDAVQFDLPISHQEYLLSTTYLKSAFEAIPLYMNQTAARVQWLQTRIVIDWSPKQNQLFKNEEVPRQFDPGYVQQLIGQLQGLERELNKTRDEVISRDLTIQNLRSALGQRSLFRSEEMAQESKQVDSVIREIQGQFMRLIDYQTRSQQLITLLCADQKSPQKTNEWIDKAKKRVDYEHVKTEFNHVVEQGVENLKNLRLNLQALFKDETKEKPRSSSQEAML